MTYLQRDSSRRPDQLPGQGVADVHDRQPHQLQPLDDERGGADPNLSGASYWDELKVLVENLTTGESEIAGLIKGNQLTSTCQRFDFTLTKNYSNSQVRITINSQPFTQLDMYVDNIGFWGPNC